MRDYNYYIEKAKEKQGYLYDNQVDMALGFKGSVMCIIKKGGKHLSEDSMVKLARLAGIDPTVALIDLGYMKTDGEAKKTYAAILQKIMAVFLIAVSLIGFSNSPAQASSQMEVTNNVYYGK